MSKHVLVVEPRKEIIEDLQDRLVSINHTYDVVTSQIEARDYLHKRYKNYSYVILSLDIPVKPERPSKMIFGLNLFEEMQQIFSGREVPIIILIDRRDINANLALMISNKGAFIAAKPFQDHAELSLEDAINTAIDSNMQTDTILDKEQDCILDQNAIEVFQDEKADSFFSQETEERFLEESESEAGDDCPTKPEMIFYKNRVELCGVTVCGDKSTLIRRILDLLKERLSTGKYRSYSGYELAIIADCESGQQGISVCVSRFKSKVYSLLEDKASVLGEIIVNDRSHGYSIEDQITVVDKMSSQMKKQDFKCPAGLSDDQKLLYEYLLANKMASRAELESEFKMSKHAANRTLQSLRSIGLIRCVGQSKSTLWLPVDQ